MARALNWEKVNKEKKLSKYIYTNVEDPKVLNHLMRRPSIVKTKCITCKKNIKKDEWMVFNGKTKDCIHEECFNPSLLNELPVSFKMK